jgi:hypothetical protein
VLVRESVSHRLGIGALAAMLIAWLVTSAWAQAWIPDPGQVHLSLSYEYFSGGDNLFNNDSLDGVETNGYSIDGRRAFLGDVFSHTESLSADIGVFSWLALSTRAAVVSAIYEGRSPANVLVDDGVYHTTLQDFQIAARSPLIDRRVRVTAGLGVSTPLSDYAVRGQSAVGLGTTEIQGSLFVGLRDWGWRRSFYAQTSFTRRWVLGNDANLPQFADASFEWGFFPSARWAVSSSVQQQFAWDGLEWLSGSGSSVHGDPSQAQAQTQRSNVRYTRWALGVDRFWGESLTTSLAYTNTLWAANTTDSNVFVLTLGWGFRAPWAPESFWY